MTDFSDYILTALALVLVIEGLLYALFPDAIRKMMAMVIMMEVPKLRQFGFAVALCGFGLLWILKALNAS